MRHMDSPIHCMSTVTCHVSRAMDAGTGMNSHFFISSSKRPSHMTDLPAPILRRPYEDNNFNIFTNQGP